jgi:hypothetical protein
MHGLLVFFAVWLPGSCHDPHSVYCTHNTAPLSRPGFDAYLCYSLAFRCSSLGKVGGCFPGSRQVSIQAFRAIISFFSLLVLEYDISLFYSFLGGTSVTISDISQQLSQLRMHSCMLLAQRKGNTAYRKTVLLSLAGVELFLFTNALCLYG